MRKRVNKIDCSRVLTGLGCGEHKPAIEDFNDIFKQIDGSFDMFNVRLRAVEYPEETFYEIARKAAVEKKYFAFLYAYQFAPKGKESHLDEKIVKKVKEIAGEYFLGEILGEAGSDRAAKAKGYFKENPTCMAEEMPPQTFKNMQEAKDYYVNYIKKMTSYSKNIGLENTMLVEATALSKYNIEGGVDMPALEVMPGNPEHLISFTRGATVGYQKKGWCGYIANEWYGGYRHQDKLKEKRLDLAYKYLYLTGAKIIYLESGYNQINSFGYHYGFDSPESKLYRDTLKNFYSFKQKDKRYTFGPVTKVAFLHGNLDAYTGFMGSSIWSQFDKKEWGMSYPEYSWRILNEVYRGRDWHDFANFGKGCDFSNSVAYGQYDVLPIESDLSVMENYDLLIFAGWNTMTDDIYDKLKKYVEKGGHLVACSAHLNTNNKRDGEYYPIKKGKISDLFGVEITGKATTNDGVKFYADGLGKDVQYPGTLDFICDCNYCYGYADYVTIKLIDAKPVCFFEDKFAPAPKDMESVRPAVVENKVGNGVATLITYLDYPGNPAVYPLYYVVVKELLTASNRNCDLKVVCGDKVRYALFYDEKGNEKLYLLNTDFNVIQHVRVNYLGEERETTLSPCEIISFDFFNK